MAETPEQLYERVVGSLRMPPVEESGPTSGGCSTRRERHLPSLPEEIWRENLAAVKAALEE